MSTLTSLNTIISSNKVPSLEVDSSNYQQIKLKNTTKSVENALPQTRCAVFLSLFFVDHRRLLTVYCPQNRLTDKTNVKILFFISSSFFFSERAQMRFISACTCFDDIFVCNIQQKFTKRICSVKILRVCFLSQKFAECS